MRCFNMGLILICLILFSINCGGESNDWKQWSIEENNDLLTISYGSASNFPQYGVIDLASSFLRMNYGYGSGWGSSILVVPSFWEKGILFQGAKVTPGWIVDGDDAVVTLNGGISGLIVNITIRFSPPLEERFSAHVTVKIEGDIALDDRPGEAYKLVTLASMRTATDYWDTRIAFAGDIQADIPEDGWFFRPPVQNSKFGLIGGSSSWKEKTPTTEIILDRNVVDITGWVTYSEEPNDDNVGLWGATNYVVRSYSFTVTVKP